MTKNLLIVPATDCYTGMRNAILENGNKVPGEVRGQLKVSDSMIEDLHDPQNMVICDFVRSKKPKSIAETTRALKGVCGQVSLRINCLIYIGVIRISKTRKPVVFWDSLVFDKVKENRDMNLEFASSDLELFDLAPRNAKGLYFGYYDNWDTPEEKIEWDEEFRASLEED